MFNSIQNLDVAKYETLGVLMDEAIATSPEIAYSRVRCVASDGREAVAALILCAVKGTRGYDFFARRDTSTERIPASVIRTRTVQDAIVETFKRKSDISCYTTDPELYIYVTIKPETIEYLRNEVLTD